MEKPIRPVVYTFIICLILFLLWTFTALRDIYLPTLWDGVTADGRFYIVTAFIFTIFSVGLVSNFRNKFRNTKALKLLIGETVLLLLWLLGFYYIRIIFFGVSVFPLWNSSHGFLKGSSRDTSMPMHEIFDLIFFMVIFVTIGLLIFTSIRLRKIKKERSAIS
jgi:hypothetical protein